MTKPNELTTVLPFGITKCQCNCGQLVLSGFGYYDPQTEKKIDNCPHCKKELSMLTIKVVKNG